MDGVGRVGFSHRRLAIVDLSSAGHQPMHSVRGRFTLVFNGEIYNHLALRNKLEKEGFAFDWRVTPIQKRCWPASKAGVLMRH
ncbi:hypothetical protein [Pseudomonas sp. Teo4]|uniref:hypothetical protein n=1 Tax=Pseudomonas sp. Teo4 TaxID=3064528 RepID=UPI002ACB0B9B|nr:hypothetical protein [Pseudomonas sp. Teo4]